MAKYYLYDVDKDCLVYQSNDSDEIQSKCDSVSLEFGANCQVLEEDLDDYVPLTFSLRSFLYKVVKWIKSYYKDLKI